MSLSDMMRTSVSGMNAQSTRLSGVSDNIANAATIGYKRVDAQFSTLLTDPGAPGYTPAPVRANIRHAISLQGAMDYTSSPTDLAVSGNGFFVVSDSAGVPALTRAGSFVKDGQGFLVNAAGYRLMGYPGDAGGGAQSATGFGGMVPVNLETLAQLAAPSTAGTVVSNLPADAAVQTAPLPSANVPTSSYTARTSVVAYSNLGSPVTFDVYYSKTAAETWDVAVYDRATAATGGGFPYSAAALSTATLTFDATTGALAPASPTSLSIAVPNGATMTLDLTGSTQLASSFSVSKSTIDGHAPSKVDRVEVSSKGDLISVYESGERKTSYRIPIATVTSPDNLTSLSGNTYTPGPDSGTLEIAEAGTGALGTIASGALEKSNVDMASELTTMIEAQRYYAANSKVFQTGSEVLDVLTNLVR